MSASLNANTRLAIIPSRGATICDYLRQAAAILAKSGLSKPDLGRLWVLADADRDGKLCRHEFAVAMHLAACAVEKDGLPLPATLPPCLTAAATTIAGGASGQGGEDKEREVEGRVVLVDEAKSVVSSLGYPEGLSDAEGSERGDVQGTGDKTRRKEKTGKMSQTASVAIDSEATADAPDGKKDAPRVGDGVFKDVDATVVAASNTSGKIEDGSEERGEAGMKKGNKGDSRYTMSAQDTVRYGKAFDKLVKGKRAKSLSGKEVRVSMSSRAKKNSLRTCSTQTRR